MKTGKKPVKKIKPRIVHTFPLTRYIYGRHFYNDEEYDEYLKEKPGFDGRLSLGGDWCGGQQMIEALINTGAPLGSKIKVTLTLVEE